jgi:hypothetical protein
MKTILLSLIRFYQFFISPWLGKNCRFEPTCSAYAKEAISKHGVILGVVLSFKRLARCHPYSQGGYDPVPKNFSKAQANNDAKE